MVQSKGCKYWARCSTMGVSGVEGREEVGFGGKRAQEGSRMRCCHLRQFVILTISSNVCISMARSPDRIQKNSYKGQSGQEMGTVVGVQGGLSLCQAS